MAKLELWYPVKNPFIISQRFGENQVPLYKELGMLGHNGWDIVGNYGQIIRAAHEGIVTFTGEDGSGGLGVVIRTQNQYDYNGGRAYFKSIYWHCKPQSFRVKVGDTVDIGTVLAECDTTGKASNSHLHFGLKPVNKGEEDWQWYNIEQDNGYLGAIDPISYWNGNYAVDAMLILSILKSMVEALKKLINILK